MINLQVIKNEKADRDKTYAKGELKRWVDDLPEDITGFIICAVKQLPNGDVWNQNHSAGNTVADRFLAQHMGIIEFMQYKGQRD
jgi:hypothetical protein